MIQAFASGIGSVVIGLSLGCNEIGALGVYFCASLFAVAYSISMVRLAAQAKEPNRARQK